VVKSYRDDAPAFVPKTTTQAYVRVQLASNYATKCHRLSMEVVPLAVELRRRSNT